MRAALAKWIGGTLIGSVLLAGVAYVAFVPSAKEPEYEFVASWGGQGAAPGAFHDPTGVAVAGDEVFVADARNGRIQVFDFQGNLIRVFGTPGKALGELGRPMNLTVARGHLYVPEYFNDRIQVFSLHGTPVATSGAAGSGPGELDAPGGVGVDSAGNLYVADFYNQRVQMLRSDGTFFRQWGETRRSGIGAGQLSYPTDVAVAADGTVYVADGYNDRIQVFDAEGGFVRKWGGPFAMNIFGPFNGWFATVTSVALDAQGNVFVADFYNHRIQKFAADGTFLTGFGGEGSGPAQFNYPIAVAVAADGTVFVADYGNHRVQRWQPCCR